MVTTFEVPRTKLVGRVVGKPSISFGRGVNCRLTVQIPNDAGDGYETYEIVITKGHKPWLIKEGAMVCAIGILRDNILWCDSFWRY